MQEAGPNAPPRPVRVNEERPDVRRITAWAGPFVLIRPALVPAIQCPPPVPPAAADDLGPCLGDKISPVGNKPRVRPEGMPEGAPNLHLGVVAQAEGAHRAEDEGLQRGQVAGSGGGGRRA